MTAYVDESLRLTGDGLYLVAAAVVHGDEDRAREVLRDALLPGQFRFHWRDEQARQRARMLAVIAELDVAIFGYVCRPMPRRQDRARALGLNALVWDLQDLDELEVVIESREAHNDRKDARTIEQAKRAGTAPRELVYRFRTTDGRTAVVASRRRRRCPHSSSGGRRP